MAVTTAALVQVLVEKIANFSTRSPPVMAFGRQVEYARQVSCERSAQIGRERQ